MQGLDRYYLVFDSNTAGNYENGFLYTLLVFITFWILFSYLVPISLFVTLEIVKFWQGFVFINFDPEMRDKSGESAKARNSNLNEDLGKIDYIFSDKTGTLTSNEMRLRLVAIKGQPLGDLNRNLEERPDLGGLDALQYFSAVMHDAVQVRCAQHIMATVHSARAIISFRCKGFCASALAPALVAVCASTLATSDAHSVSSALPETEGRCVQALKSDPEKWEAVLRKAGSPAELLAMKDSVSGDPQLSLGAAAGHFLPYHVIDFWINLALCHALLVDKSDGGVSYQVWLSPPLFCRPRALLPCRQE